MNTKLIPLFSISGLTLFSLSGLIFLKNKDSSYGRTDVSAPAPTSSPRRSLPGEGGTQVPKSIEHYLLTSQQFFTQALDAQNQKKSPETVTNLLNRSLSFANESIKVFPNDFRAYLQRGQIYQSLTSSQTQLLDPAISDYLTAQKLNPNSVEITRMLAQLFAKKGDAQNTLTYLSKTVSLEPTKAQNFYDLARLQQQAGLINNAITTYDKLLSIITDPTQKSTIESEKLALEKLASQSPNQPSFISPEPSAKADEPLLQAGLPAGALAEAGLIIAAPETSKDILVTNQTDSNSLSGNATLPASQTQLKIDNSKITSSSQIYVSTISGGKNQTLEVKSKSSDSFTVGISSPITEDILFKWWIVN